MRMKKYYKCPHRSCSGGQKKKQEFSYNGLKKHKLTPHDCPIGCPHCPSIRPVNNLLLKCNHVNCDDHTNITSKSGLHAHQRKEHHCSPYKCMLCLKRIRQTKEEEKESPNCNYNVNEKNERRTVTFKLDNISQKEKKDKVEEFYNRNVNFSEEFKLIDEDYNSLFSCFLHNRIKN